MSKVAVALELGSRPWCVLLCVLEEEGDGTNKRRRKGKRVLQLEFVRWVACNDMRTLVSSCGREHQFKLWVQLPANSKLDIIAPFHDPNNFFMLPNQVSNVGMSLLQGSIGGVAPNNCISAVAIIMPVVSSSSSSSPESFKPPHLQLITPRLQ
ncbi:unnamed protein product [Sphagnum balticum]